MAYSTPIFSTIKSTGANGGTTDAADSTGCDILFIWVSEYAGGTHTAPTDSKSNTWTELTTSDQGSDAQGTLWYCQNPSVGSGHTVSYGGVSSYSTIAFWGHSGSATSPADQQNGATGTTNSLATGSVTPTEANELVIAGVCTAGTQGSGFSVGGGFSVIQSFNYNGAATMGLCVAYLIQTSAAAANLSFSWTNSVPAAAKIATFKAAAGGGGGGFRSRIAGGLVVSA